MPPLTEFLRSVASGDIPRNPRGAELNSVCISFTAIAALFVGARLLIRVQRKLLGLDDLCIGIALLSSTILTITTGISVSYGYGLYTTQVPRKDASTALFYWYLAQVFYKAVTWPTKISVLLMYRRVFMVNDDLKMYGLQFRTFFWATFALVVACFVSFEAAGIFQCDPVHRSWDHTIPGTCVAMVPRWYSYAAFNFVTDLMILAMPIPMINSLVHIDRRQKTEVTVVFAIGGFVCITTLIRMSKFDIKADMLYNGISSSEWSSIEANTGIVCACLPLLRPVVTFLAPWFTQWSGLGRRLRSRSSDENLALPGADIGTGSVGQSGLGVEANDVSWPGWNRRRGDVLEMITGGGGESRRGSRRDSERALGEGIRRKSKVKTVVEPTPEDDDDKDGDDLSVHKVGDVMAKQDYK